MARTKIVATIGPASSNENTLRRMMESGMNVARINFSHGNHRTHSETVEKVRRVAAAIGKTIAILGDLQGPKLRVGDIEGGGIDLEPGQEVVLSSDGTEGSIAFPHPELYDAIKPGARLVIGDGEVALTVLDRQDTVIHCVTTVAGRMGSRKGVNLPGTNLPIPSVTEKDKRDLAFICDMDLDYVALSFVRSPDDIRELRDLIAEHDARIPIIAKIEKSEALEHLDEIAEVTDGMMVARGDLGIDCPAQEVPIHQKRIIATCNAAGIPVITATQMLQSMVEHPYPTRAEASDVANAILDGSDAVMLSNETAAGAYPVESVAMMKDIASITEANFPYDTWEQRRRDSLDKSTSVTEAISAATVGIARRMNCKAILTTTMSGYTARMVARFRPRTPVIAISPLSHTHRQLALVWGVESVSVPRFSSTDEMIEETIAAVLKLGAAVGDRVVMTAGVPFGQTGHTNLLEIHEISVSDMRLI